jgi:dethiobiotin synthetase
MRPFFITASGTNVGKTLVTTALCSQLQQEGKAVTAIKPVISGYNPKDMGCDSALILRSCGVTPTPQLMEVISPWRYEAFLAPNMAAAIEGNPVDLNKLVEFCREHTSVESDIVLCEGVGGIMAPINDQHTVLDWIQELAWPVIMVCGSYLGAISHTLTAIESLKARGVSPKALILSETDGSTVLLADTATTLEKFLPPSIPIVKLPLIAPQDEIWTKVPLISWLCDL